MLFLHFIAYLPKITFASAFSDGSLITNFKLTSCNIKQNMTKRCAMLNLNGCKQKMMVEVPCDKGYGFENDRCVRCLPGYISKNLEYSRCEACPRNTYHSEFSCVDCGDGWSSPGSTECTTYCTQHHFLEVSNFDGIIGCIRG